MQNSFKVLEEEYENAITPASQKQLQQLESGLTSKLRLFRMIGETIDLYSSRFAETMTSMMNTVPPLAEASARGMAYMLNEMAFDSSLPSHAVSSHIAFTIKEQESEEATIYHSQLALEQMLVQLEIPLSAYLLIKIEPKLSRTVLRLEEGSAERILNAFRNGTIHNKLIDSIGWYDYQTSAFLLPSGMDIKSVITKLKVLVASEKLEQALEEALQFFVSKSQEVHNHLLAQKVEIALIKSTNRPPDQDNGFLKVEQSFNRILSRLP